MSSFKNILLINFGGIGDEILFLPVIRSVRQMYPKSKITLCLEGRSRAFTQLTDLIDNYFFVDIKTKNKYIEMLKLYFKALFGRFDLVISSGSNPLISLLLFCTGIKTRIGYGSSSIAKRLLTHSVTLNKNQYASKMYYDLAKSISDIPFELPAIKIDSEIQKETNSVLVHPGVSQISIRKNITKTVTAELWAEIILKLLERGKKVYLAGGSDDLECIQKIRNFLKDKDLTNFTDLFGQTKNIHDLAVLIKKSELLLCSDSAPMHIGVAVNTKTAAIFGPTDDSVLLPDNDNFLAVKNNAQCRPCLWAKRQTTCSELTCLKFNADEIINKLEKFI